MKNTAFINESVLFSTKLDLSIHEFQCNYLIMRVPVGSCLNGSIDSNFMDFDFFGWEPSMSELTFPGPKGQLQYNF